jgi:hypothetical protein
MTALASPSSPGDAADGRDRRLVSVLSRARRGRLSAEGWMIAAGSAFAVAGLLLVIVGWAGTSRTVLVAGQIPYVVSGGLLGLGLVFLGGFLYFAYWLALMVRTSDEQATQTREDFARLEAGIAEAAESLAVMVQLMEAGATPRRRRSSTALSGASRSIILSADRLVATPAGTMAHRPDCPVVANRKDTHDIPPGTDMRRCGICRPQI